MIQEQKVTVTDKFQEKLDAWTRRCQETVEIHERLFLLSQELKALILKSAMLKNRTLTTELSEARTLIEQFI